jgi:hypothetical protein
MGRVAKNSLHALTFEGTPVNCDALGTIGGSNDEVTINFTSAISDSHPKVMLAATGNATTANILILSISQTALVVKLGDSSAHSFHFAVFA